MIKLKTFTLQEYNPDDIDHKSTMISLFNDKDTNTFMGNVEDFGKNILKAKDGYSNMYIAYKDDNPIGLVSLYFLDSKYEVCYAILPEYRQQGLASLLLGEYTDYIFNNTNIEDLYLYINKANRNSIIVANRNGYNKTAGVEYKRSK